MDNTIMKDINREIQMSDLVIIDGEIIKNRIGRTTDTINTSYYRKIIDIKTKDLTNKN